MDRQLEQVKILIWRQGSDLARTKTQFRDKILEEIPASCQPPQVHLCISCFLNSICLHIDKETYFASHFHRKPQPSLLVYGDSMRRYMHCRSING
jgi:hypothetical protein